MSKPTNPHFKTPDDSERTEMIIPVSKKSFFNTKWHRKSEPLCPYDMLFHPPDYDPKAARSDRQDPNKIRQNIWDQEFHKAIPSTTHFAYGRPKWKILDRPSKEFNVIQAKDQNASMRIHNALQWAELLDIGKPSICV